MPRTNPASWSRSSPIWVTWQTRLSIFLSMNSPMSTTRFGSMFIISQTPVSLTGSSPSSSSSG
jgi:hypothetical protein